MKELSIEQKAQRYDEAIKVAKNSLINSDFPGFIRADVVFPELKEFEDTRIRNTLINYIKNEDYILNTFCGISTDDALTWLEKQSKTFTKKDVDDAYLKGVTNAKNEIEKQYEATYQIRKDIATFIFNYRGDIKDRAKWINYLGIKVSFVEKQGEQPQGKSALEAAKEEKVDNQSCVKPTDKVEPKFKVGDWIFCERLNTAKIISIENGRYEVEFIDGNKSFPDIDYIDKKFNLWNIEDAKDGDILISRYNDPFIYNGYNDGICIGAYCALVTGDIFHVETEKCHWTKNVENYPVTKEQREIFFKKMKDAGYEFDFDKKKLKKIK